MRATFVDRPAGHDMGKGCLRFLLRATVAGEGGLVC